MQKPSRTGPLQREDESEFLGLLQRDAILHLFTIHDLKNARDKTRIWTAAQNGNVQGYLFQYDQRIIHTHGTAESIVELLPYAQLEECTFVAEPHHLEVIERAFEPLAPSDAASKGKITTYLVMRTDSGHFKPLIRHHVKRLTIEDSDEAQRNLNEEYAKRIRDLSTRGLAYAAYEENAMAAVGMVPEIVDQIAFVRGVYTNPVLRGRGLSTSVVSALVQELVNMHKTPVLWVAEDNLPAVHVYEKVGFYMTGITLLGFKARKL